MNQGRIWCVVSPTVGLPLFLGSVALTSLVVHASVMSHTTWMSNYWQGKAARVTQNTTATGQTASIGNSGVSMTVTQVPGASAAAPASFVITVTPSATVAKTLPASFTLLPHAPAPAPVRSASAG
jgi:light-harvesting protein B-800-850 alpha chain